MQVIDLDQYNVPNPILIGITKVINECIDKKYNVRSIIHSENSEVNRFINDCIIALN